MTRLYLTHNDRYRVRLASGDTVSCRWDDPHMRFVVKTMRGDRVLVTDNIKSVSPVENNRTIVWTSLGHCFRDMHKGKEGKQRKERADSGSTWQHPYKSPPPKTRRVGSPFQWMGRDGTTQED
jgi:hypothetical protein